MRLLKKIAGFLGFAKDDCHETKEEDEEDANPSNSDDVRPNRMNVDPVHTGPRKGFSVPVQVAVERPVVGPIFLPCNGDGGVQGLRWYADRLRIDEDGEVADEFFHEVSSEMSHVMQDQPNSPPRLQVRPSVRHANKVKVRRQQVTPNGKFQHLIEYHGQYKWV